MQYSDYPHTLAALKRHLPSISDIRASHGGAIAAVNSVRNEVGLPPINIDELVLATLGRIEDKLATPITTFILNQDED
jgi:hypothetical protein